MPQQQQPSQALLNQLNSLQPADISKEQAGEFQTPTIITNEEQQRLNAAAGQQQNLQTSQAQYDQQQPQQTTDTNLDEVGAKWLKEKYGLTPEQLQQGIEQYGQSQVSEAMQTMMNTWGVDQNEVTRRIQEVQSQYGSFLQANPQFDTVEGINLLWAQVQSSQKFDKPSSFVQSTPSQPQYKFTFSQLMEMSDDERRRRDQEITAAHAAGQVDMTR